MKRELKKEEPFSMELFFAALSDNTRLRLLNLMRDAEVCVCYFVEVIGTNQPKISRHLAYLRKAGIVAVRREGIWAHYRITLPENKRAAKVLGEILDWLAEDEGMRLDCVQMMKMCCAPVKLMPVAIQGAPLPKRIKEEVSV